MKHVFVETNWVVAYAAPAHHQVPAARELLQKAARGELRLLLPSVCLTEARHTITRNYQPRNEADAIRMFLASHKGSGKIEVDDEVAVRRVLSMFENSVRGELRSLDARLAALRDAAGVEVFALTEAMLAQTAELGTIPLHLQPFDQAILGAILVRGADLLAGHHQASFFCELDGNLQPWDSNGDRKSLLADLYDRAGVWVCSDFELSHPPCPEDWPRRA